MYDIIVIGAGFSGAYAALELVKDKYKILVIEKGSRVVGADSTSYNQCYKLHSGVHYFGDAITARKCLISSIICARQWNKFLLGAPGSLPRRNRHYVLSNSLFSVAKARKVAAMLKQTYTRLVQEDPKNQVFGDPKDFIREVNPDQYNYVAQEIAFVKQEGVIEKASVVLAFDAGEPQVDIHRIQKYLHHKITHMENIKTQFNCKVVSIDPYKEGFGYKVRALKQDKTGKTIPIEFWSKGVVNCAWQNIEELNKTADLCCDNVFGKLLIRMKISVLAKLPQKLQNMDTCIFSLGPYCSITNQYDGTAVLTYEPVTNVGHYFQGESPPKIVQAIQREKKSLQETILGKRMAKDIIAGCAIYVPEMKNAEALEVRVGYVKMYTDQRDNYSIYSRNSPIHERRESGIVTHNAAPCYISASGMKMTYTQSNAEKIRVLMKQEMEKQVCGKRGAKQLRCCKQRQIFEQSAVLRRTKKFIVDTIKDYELANKEKKTSIVPSLLRDPVTLQFFIPGATKVRPDNMVLTQ